MNTFDDMIRDGFDSAFEEMSEDMRPVLYRADEDGEFVACRAIVQGVRKAENFTEDGIEQTKTRTFTLISNPDSVYCITEPVVKYGTIAFDGIAYTITDVEESSGIVDVSTVHSGIFELSREGFRK